MPNIFKLTRTNGTPEWVTRVRLDCLRMLADWQLRLA